MSIRLRAGLSCGMVLALIGAVVEVRSQTRGAGFTIEQVMSPAFPYGLVLSLIHI